MQKETNEPIEYVRGFAEFLGCKIDLSKKPLIPRPETAYWVKKVLCDIRTGVKVLDIFCGSGCIGLAILSALGGPASGGKRVQVTFADKYKYFDNPSFIKSDVFSNIKGRFDYIFANPPYVAKNKKHLVQKSVLNYEPRSALFAGTDGLFYIKKFLKQVKSHLNPNGVIFMEFSPEQKPAIGDLVKKYGYKIDFYKDQYDRWRWARIS